MKSKLLTMLTRLVLLSTLGLQSTTAFAQGTAFTYQGRLNDNGTPANGSYDLEFTLFNTNQSGFSVAPILTNTAVPVNDGLFTVTLDFGPGVFSVTNLWLEIGARTNGNGAFTTLTPRQPITPAPYAITAENVNNLPGLKVQQNTNGAPNLVGGSQNNFVTAGLVGATISGGGAVIYAGAHYTNKVIGSFGTVGGGAGNAASAFATASGGYQNTAGGAYATVSGGAGNSASDIYTTVGGGNNNTASINDATVGGGEGNTARGSYATVGGGLGGTASGFAATVGGGSGNTASGDDATVGGGNGNAASGDNSFAAGNLAHAAHNGSFVWADGNAFNFSSTIANGFFVRCTGGAKFVTAIDSSGNQTAGVHILNGDTAWSSISDKNSKKNFKPLNGEAVLKKLAAIPIEQWNYKWEADTNTPHIGPMAQDFKAAFYPGRDDKSISTLEFDGVELAAIQGLNQKLREKNSEIKNLQEQNKSLAERLAELERTVQGLAEKP